jgi:hypothetical protein
METTVADVPGMDTPAADAMDAADVVAEDVAPMDAADVVAEDVARMDAPDGDGASVDARLDAADVADAADGAGAAADRPDVTPGEAPRRSQPARHASRFLGVGGATTAARTSVCSGMRADLHRAIRARDGSLLERHRGAPPGSRTFECRVLRASSVRPESAGGPGCSFAIACLGDAIGWDVSAEGRTQAPV